MRITLTILLLIALPLVALAQERGRERETIVVPAQRAPNDVVSLNVIGATSGAGTPDLRNSMSFPRAMTRDEAIDACASEMAAFLKHQFPSQVTLVARAATCVVPEAMDDPS